MFLLQRGCIDKIPSVVSKNPKLSVLTQCFVANSWSPRKKYSCTAVGIRIDTPPQRGVLCCCAKVCPHEAMRGSPTSFEMGFHIVDGID
ncbi:unnamed protein product [Gongylonema pulchrum]|uniref:ZP domain-containing protein n=1 Tax=Gongylonema pulchrum TaxID=637853 RepID=A0A183DV79_9BILA|nr:unnamed protein product [Gongylonema pulchrum]